MPASATLGSHDGWLPKNGLPGQRPDDAPERGRGRDPALLVRLPARHHNMHRVHLSKTESACSSMLAPTHSLTTHAASSCPS